MILVNVARGLIAALRSLTGARATGRALVSRTGASTTKLPCGSFGLPIVDGAIRYDRLVRVMPNPDTADHAWVVTTDTPVDVASNVGGLDRNLASGTRVRWFPAPDGVEAVSELDPSGLTGGTAPTGLAVVRQLELLDEMPPGGISGILSAGGLTTFPAVVLAWEGSGGRVTRGNGRWTTVETWGLYLVVSRQDAAADRRLEGLVLVDEIEACMQGLSAVDGVALSAPDSVNVASRRTLLTDPKFFVYQLKLETTVARERRDLRTWAPWVTTRVDVQTDTSEPLTEVENNLVEMPQ